MIERYVRFKHVVDGDTLEVSMLPDTSMQFAWSTDDADVVINEQIDVEDGVLRRFVTHKEQGRKTRSTTYEMHCHLDQLTTNDGFPAWYEVRRGEQHGI